MIYGKDAKADAVQSYTPLQSFPKDNTKVHTSIARWQCRVIYRNSITLLFIYLCRGSIAERRRRTVPKVSRPGGNPPPSLRPRPLRTPLSNRSSLSRPSVFDTSAKETSTSDRCSREVSPRSHMSLLISVYNNQTRRVLLTPLGAHYGRCARIGGAPPPVSLTALRPRGRRGASRPR